MKFQHQIIILLLLISLINGCSKPAFEMSYELIDLPVAAKVRCLEVRGDSLIIGGGDVNEEGFVIQSNRAIAQFHLITDTLTKEVYDLTHFQGRWFFGLDSVEMLISEDLSSFQTYYWRQEDWVSDLSKHPIRRFAQTNDGLYAVAGGKLTFGVIYQTSDAKVWNPLEFDNELRSICTFENTVWAAGNGRLMRLRKGEDWERIELNDRFIADMVFTSKLRGIGITYDGRAIITTDGGDSWSNVKQKSKGFLNRVVVENDISIAVGNAGLIGISQNNGESWKWYVLKERLDLNDVLIVDDHCVIAADEGVLIRFSLASLK